MVLKDGFKFARSPRNHKNKWTLEQRIAASIRHRGIGKGRKLSDETRKKLSEMRMGDKNPFYGKTHTPEVCEKIRQTHIGRKQTEEHKKKRAMKGELNPMWKGGISHNPYCEKFNENFKQRVRLFFDNKCVLCGKSPENNCKDKRQLVVHHVNYDKMTCCNDGEPLFVVLCMSCHRMVHSHGAWWKEYFSKLINYKYSDKCYYTKEEFKKVK